MQRSPAFLYAALLSAALAAPVLAQQQPPASQTPSPMQAPAVPQPSDQQLQRFASASQKVSGVVDEYRPRSNRPRPTRPSRSWSRKPTRKWCSWCAPTA